MMHPFSIPSKTQPLATQCSTATASACPSLRYYNFNRELNERRAFCSFVFQLLWLLAGSINRTTDFLPSSSGLICDFDISSVARIFEFFLLSCQKKKKTVSCFLHWYLLKTVRWMDGSIWPPATNRCVSPMLFCVFLQILTVEVFRLRNKFHSNRQTRASSHNIPSLRIPVAMVIHVVVIFLFGAACSQLTTDFCKYTVGRLR